MSAYDPGQSDQYCARARRQIKVGELYAQGMTIAEIAKTVGCSRHAVALDLEDMEMRPRAKTGRPPKARGEVA